jgi:hypothetical protein
LGFKPCEEKGLGMVALRAFQKNDVIMVERPILTFDKHTDTPPRIDQIEARAQPAALALYPQNGDFLSKLKTNSVGCASGTTESGLFLTMSRTNHHCFGNSDQFYLGNRRVQILVARNNITSGEEVTFAYIDFLKDYYPDRRKRLFDCYGFVCRCCVCRDPDLEADMYKMKKLDEEICHFGMHGVINVALERGKALLKLYDKRGMSSWDYHRTYFDLFQMAISRRQTFEAAEKYIRQAYESILACTKV